MTIPESGESRPREDILQELAKERQALTELQKVGNELSQADTFDDLCRQAIVLGRSRLGFDRLSLWFREAGTHSARGAFGTDEHGNLRDERGDRVVFNAASVMGRVLMGDGSPHVEHNAPLYSDQAKPVGRGTHVMAPLTHGADIIGCVTTDNLITQSEITDFDVQLLALYASTLGHLCARKRAERGLREARAFLENMSDIAYTADEQGNVTWTNPAAERIIGLPVEQIVGKPLLPLFVEPDRDSVVEKYKRTLRGESLETLLTFTSGVTCHFSCLPKRNGKGDIIGTFGVARDITKRLAAEKALAVSEERLRKAQAVARTGNWEYDVATGKVWGSEEAFRIYGIERTSECLPLNEVEDHIVEAGRVRQALNDLLTEKKPYDIEYLIESPSRQGPTHIRAIAELVCGEDGKPVKVLGVIQDITEMRRSEQEQQRLQEQLTQAQKMEAIGQLAGGVAHDFNNLLQVILGCGELALEEGEADGARRALVEDMLEAGTRAKSLVSQLLAFSRRQVLDMREIDLNENVGDMLKMLRRVIGEQVNLNFLGGHDLDTVRADAGQVGQILTNLCVNSRDAMPDGGTITIETRNTVFDKSFSETHPWARPGRFVLLRVTDTGCGIDEETLEHVFEPFFTTKGVGEGSGLGLSTVYGLVQQHEGLVHVDSEAGEGTAVSIYLPAVGSGAPAVEKEAPQSLPGGSETILLAEDDTMVRHLTKSILERAGYSILTACDGEEALAVFTKRADEIDLALLDVMMPKLGGRAVYEGIREIRPDVRVIFASGYSMDTIESDFLVEESVRLIQKPTRREELLRTVREVLDAE